MVLWAIENSMGGEIFVPKLPSYRISDLATAIGPSCDHKYIGIRPGEKIHEEMITESDSLSTVDLGKYYAILPSERDDSVVKYCDLMGAEAVSKGFFYNSGKNSEFLDVEKIRKLIKIHIRSDFEPV